MVPRWKSRSRGAGDGHGRRECPRRFGACPRASGSARRSPTAVATVPRPTPPREGVAALLPAAAAGCETAQADSAPPTGASASIVPRSPWRCPRPAGGERRLEFARVDRSGRAGRRCGLRRGGWCKRPARPGRRGPSAQCPPGAGPSCARPGPDQRGRLSLRSCRASAAPESARRTGCWAGWRCFDRRPLHRCAPSGGSAPSPRAPGPAAGTSRRRTRAASIRFGPVPPGPKLRLRRAAPPRRRDASPAPGPQRSRRGRSRPRTPTRSAGHGTTQGGQRPARAGARRPRPLFSAGQEKISRAGFP